VSDKIVLILAVSFMLVAGFSLVQSVSATTEEDLLLTINNPTPEIDDRFGFSVATTPDGNLLIGAFADNTVGNGAGSAYLFDGTTGAVLLTIDNPTPATGDLFSESVASTPDGNIIVGAQGDNIGVAQTGSAYIFSTD